MAGAASGWLLTPGSEKHGGAAYNQFTAVIVVDIGRSMIYRDRGLVELAAA